VNAADQKRMVTVAGQIEVQPKLPCKAIWQQNVTMSYSFTGTDHLLFLWP
jgi:hypothetical protein